MTFALDSARPRGNFDQILSKQEGSQGALCGHRWTQTRANCSGRLKT